MIGKQICIRRVGLILVLGILLYSWDVSSLKHKTTEKNTMVDRDSFDIDNDDVAELLWLKCRSEILEIKYIVEDVDICIPHIQGADNSLNLKCQPEDKEKLREFLSMLRPELKLSLTDCLRRNGLLRFEYIFKAKEEDVWVNEELESISSRLPINDIRRSLASSKKRSRSKKRKAEHQKIIIIAMAATASVTFLLAMLLFLCFYKCYGSSSDDRLNDEKPLLCLSSTDRSSGSSHRRYGSGDLLKDGHIDDQQLKHISSSKSKLSSSSFSSDKNGSDPIIVTPDLKPQSSGRVSSALELHPPEGSLLAPPPGRAVSSLKPPPGGNPNPTGMAEPPLPPEPPVPPKPPTRTNEALAPPPPPPPPAASTSAPAPPPPPPGSGGRKPSGPPPPPPPTPGGKRVGPPPPPQPKGGGGPGRPPPQPMAGKFGKAPPLAPGSLGRPGDGGSKTKLKPFFWDKVLANPNSTMVWDQLKAGSFQFSEETIESLFGADNNNNNKNKKEIKKDSSQETSITIIQIIDPKKSQNLSILLKALNVTIQEVCDALLEGHELPLEFLQTVLKMAPTQEEELKLRVFNGEVSQLGTADRFLKSLVDIPFAFKRMEALIFMITLEEEVTFVKKSFENLEVACKELRSSRLFFKLLEAVLKTGNRMNSGTYRGGAQAFKLDTLLKLADVRGADGKTTLLHFVVQEIIRSEGIRAARAAKESLSFSSIKSEDLLEDVHPEESEEYYRGLGLQVVSVLSDGLENVKKAAGIDADNLTGTVAKLGHAIMRTREFMNTDMNNLQEESGFHNTLKSFIKNAEADVMWLLEEEKRIMALVKTTADYFHGNTGKDEGLRLFVIVRDFLVMLEKACKEVKDAPKKKQQVQQKKDGAPSLAPSSSDSRLKESPIGPKMLAPSSSDSSIPMSQEMLRQRFFPAVQQQQRNAGDSSSSSSSSDDDD